MDTVISPKQAASIRDATAGLNIWTGAIRSGKTIGSLWRFILDVPRAPIEGEIVIVGNTKDTVYRNVITPLQNGALFGPLANEVVCRAGADKAQILGRTVHILGAYDSKAENRIRGMTVALAYVDEVTLVQEDFFAQLRGRMSVPGAKMLATTNPDSPSHWFKKNYLDSGNVELRHFHFTLDDNPYLTEQYKAERKREFVGLFYERFILGKWVAGSGAIYSMWDPSIHVVKELPSITNWVGVGIDYGDVNPTAALLGGIGADGCLYFASEYRNAGKESARPRTVAEHSMAIRKWIADRGVHPNFWCVDPAAAAFRNQLYADGVSGVHKANNDVVPGIQVMSSLLAANKLKVHSSCKGFIDEIPNYSWDDKKVLLGQEAPVKVDDHSLDAGRYLVNSTKKIWRGFIPSLASM